MVLPTKQVLSITIDGNDVSANVPFDSIVFDDYAREVSSWSMRIENPTTAPAKNDAVVITDTTASATLFKGYITRVKSKKHGNGIQVHYDVECADQKVLLQKSVLDVTSLSGTDTSIISALLSNAYPDLSSLFDFSAGVTGFAEDLELPVGNSNILDALNALQDLTGGYMNFEEVTQADANLEAGADMTEWATGAGTDVTVTRFNSGSTSMSDEEMLVYDTFASVTSPSRDVSAGNSGACVRFNPSTGTIGTNQRMDFRWNPVAYAAFGTFNPADFSFDYYIDSGMEGNVDTTGSGNGLRITLELVSLNPTDTYTWVLTEYTFDQWTSTGILNGSWTLLEGTPVKTIAETEPAGDPLFRLEVAFAGISVNAATTTVDFRFDNMSYQQVYTPSNLSQLNYSETPPQTDFDLDIGSSDEFAYDIEFDVGDWDNYNSITVIGYESEAVDWTYESDGDLDHFDLEAPIDSLQVSVNTGSDGSPSWSSQTIGEWGKDELGVGGIDVLYDEKYHWLYFNTKPSALSKAIRVEGFIRRPIRVRVETGETPVLATTYVDENISSEEQALEVGLTKLTNQAAPRTLRFTTYEPGLRPGQEINVTDSGRGLNEDLVIQKITTTYVSPERAKFEIEAGNDLARGVDDIIADNDKRSRESTVQAGITVKTATTLTTNGEVLTTGGLSLFEVG